MKKFFLLFLLLSNYIFSQVKNEKQYLFDISFDSLLIKEISGKIYSESINDLIIEEAVILKNVKIEVYENDSIKVEELFSDSKGHFILRNLDYDKYYVVYFLKENYFERTVRIYTTGIEDSLKKNKFRTMLGTSLRSLTLFKKPKNEIKNPFDYDFAVLYFDRSKSLLKLKDFNNDDFNLAMICEDISYNKIAKEKDDLIICLSVNIPVRKLVTFSSSNLVKKNRDENIKIFS